ncbi:hypothetical protein [Scandinavium goeteborgense]|uniref:Uncharacterized protein n=1 Tax=Scandinavium goeteborgense TaxID=1851514 RepID=A0A4R6DR84_SCAGO|nr:hypothetical protein [Scandinavium goeteborgense]TDN47453.1 hypothetical protein EC847_13220 [Scandinavium goeteborgense]
MASDKWLASCHRRTLHTMKIKAIAMSEQWEGRDSPVINELTSLIHYIDNCEDFLYFTMKRKDIEREKSE